MIQFSKIRVALVVAFSLFLSNTYAIYSGSGTFTKISSINDLTDGYYVVAYGTTFAMDNTNAGKYFANTAITPNTNSIINPSATIVWEIKTHASGGRTIFNEASSKFVSYTGSSNESYAVNSVAGGNERWTFAYSSSLFTITNVTSSTRLLQYNISSPRFACYTGSQQNITLYKLATPTCTSSNLAFADASVNQLISAGSYTKTATSLNATTTITYSSSNETVATVNLTSGEVTPLTAGTTTITATQVAGTHNAIDYCASTASYSLNLTANAPTITVTEVEIPALMAYGGESDSEIMQVSGINLTDNIALAISGTNANLFSVSAATVSQTGGIANLTAITVNYNPIAPGTHTATLTLSSAGAISIIRNLNGSSSWKPLLTPVATDASNISGTGFTANWNAVQGATQYELSISKVNSTIATASDLFISEYIEGLSTNKAIEIYNGTGAPVNLSSYSLKKQTNGAGAYADALTLSGTIADGDVYVVANASASATILAAADLQTSSATLSFNGNDAIALFKNTTQIDEVGVYNLTSNWGTDVTLIRKSTVSSPKAAYVATEWDSNPTDYFTNLGLHTMNGSSTTSTPLLGSPFTVISENSKTFVDLIPGAIYTYSVIAKNANVTSATSNTVIATTSTTSLITIKNAISIYKANNRMIIESPIEQNIAFYNSVGQLIQHINLNAGKNEIHLNYKGICLVKSTDEILKVVL
ncbi:MAG: lamin tail domain-containing protein [Paludibacter sp.]